MYDEQPRTTFKIPNTCNDSRQVQPIGYRYIYFSCDQIEERNEIIKYWFI